MLSRWLGLAALALAPVAGVGCGGSGAATTDEAQGNRLAVYSSLPLQGPQAGISEQIVDGEKLALADAGGRVGSFDVEYVSQDDSNPASGEWSPDVTASDAKTAAQDPATIAYLGDWDSGATAISLPIINQAGVLQISPASPYVGLTESLDAGQYEPGRFYPNGQRTFARLQPGDPVEAKAQVRLMRTLGVRKLYVISDSDPSDLDLPLADLVAEAAAGAGIQVTGQDQIAVHDGGVFTGEAEKIAESGAQAVFYAGDGSEAAAELWRQLYETDPGLTLLGSRAMVNETFAGQLGPAAGNAYLTTPLLPLRLYPPAAQSVLGQYRRRFGGAPEGYVLYGYEAMSLVLSAIRAAGQRGNDRETVIRDVLSSRRRESVLGRYSIEADGEPTLARFAVDRISGGRPVFYRLVPLR